MQSTYAAHLSVKFPPAMWVRIRTEQALRRRSNRRARRQTVRPTLDTPLALPAQRPVGQCGILRGTGVSDASGARVRNPSSPGDRDENAGSAHSETRRLNGTDSPTIRATAARLLASGAPLQGSPADVAVAGEQVLNQIFKSLSRWIGSAGCDALFGRAITVSAPDHPVLTDVRHQLQKAPHLLRLSENASKYGEDATRDAITAIVTSIVAMLAGLIGEDLATSLLEEPSSTFLAPKDDSTSDGSPAALDSTDPSAGHGDAAS